MLMVVACASPSQNVEVDEAATVITNANIVDVRTGDILENRHIVISDGLVSEILEDQGQTFTGNNIIDATGKFIAPGLAEMHAHIPSPQWGRDNTDETLFLYLSNGVTTIRGMLGHPTHLDLRSQAANNEILSPRIFTSSPSINGNSVTSVEQARDVVAQYKNDGYDFLKLHPGLQLDVFDQVVATAKEVGIKYSGHVSVHVGVQHAINNKYASIDHVDGFLEGLVPESAAVDPTENGFFGYNFTDLTDMNLLDGLISSTVENEVWVVPTQSLFDRWFSPEDAESLAAAPEMQYMPKSTVEQWVNSKKGLVTDPDYSVEKWQRFNTIRQTLIKALQDNGYGLVLGSDAPQVFNVPGFSIHHEMQGMIDAGLSPLEVIQSGTVNAARFFEMEGQFGEVAKGASADLLLLESNPLDDLANLRNPTGVMVRGRWLDREVINKRLAEIAERAKNI